MKRCNILLAGLTAVLLTCLAQTGMAAAQNPQPHSAVYDIHMTRLRDAVDLEDIDGQLYFTWSDACDAWQLRQIYQLDYTFKHGEILPFRSDFSAREQKDGSHYAFSARRFRHKRLETEYRGTVQRLKNGRCRLRQTHPETATIDLPIGVLMPTAHMATLLDHARQGDRIADYPLFDGSDGPRVMQVHAALTAGEDWPDDLPESLAGMADLLRWRFHMAFYAGPLPEFIKDTLPEPPEPGLPNHEIRVDMLENSIATRMKIDFGGFVLTATLRDLTLLPHCQPE